MARVTALRERRRTVEVELDGKPWRALPVDVVARTLLRVGEELDRPRLRELRRELRRAEALGTASRALRHSDLTRRGVEQRLERARVAPAQRQEALETLARVGWVDDARVAVRRAETLAARGWGDAAIEADLEGRGVGADERAQALAALEPEAERARHVAAVRGRTAKTAAHLARRGFGEDAIETACGAIAEED